MMRVIVGYDSCRAPALEMRLSEEERRRKTMALNRGLKMYEYEGSRKFTEKYMPYKEVAAMIQTSVSCGGVILANTGEAPFLIRG